MWALRRRIVEHLARPEVDGIVVTHGTDALEEIGVPRRRDRSTSDKPVVFTGAMRTSSDLGWDGPGNLGAAVRVAASDEARGRGVLVVMSDRVFAGTRRDEDAHAHARRVRQPGARPARRDRRRASHLSPRAAGAAADSRRRRRWRSRSTSSTRSPARTRDCSTRRASGKGRGVVDRGDGARQRSAGDGRRNRSVDRRRTSRSSSRRARCADASVTRTAIRAAVDGWRSAGRSSPVRAARSRRGST